MKSVEGKDTVIFGVSCDSPFSHAAFKKQYNIPYSLLADPTRKMAKAYGMWAGEEPYNCTKRGTVVIGKDGKIAHYEEVPMREPRKLDELEKRGGEGREPRSRSRASGRCRTIAERLSQSRPNADADRAGPARTARSSRRLQANIPSVTSHRERHRRHNSMGNQPTRSVAAESCDGRDAIRSVTTSPQTKPTAEHGQRSQSTAAADREVLLP